MPDVRVPKQLLICLLPSPRPTYVPRLRWKNVILSDLGHVDIAHSGLVGDRSGSFLLARYLPLYSGPTTPYPDQSPRGDCSICHRSFRQPGGKARHQCTEAAQSDVSLFRSSMVLCSVVHASHKVPFTEPQCGQACFHLCAQRHMVSEKCNWGITCESMSTTPATLASKSMWASPFLMPSN